jgi:hypothetical protein
VGAVVGGAVVGRRVGVRVLRAVREGLVDGLGEAPAADAGGAGAAVDGRGVADWVAEAGEAGEP